MKLIRSKGNVKCLVAMAPNSLSDLKENENLI